MLLSFHMKKQKRRSNMGLKVNQNKAGYDALGDEIKALYKADGDGYALEVDGLKTQEDIDKIILNRDNILKEKRDLEGEVKALQKEKNGLSDKVNAYESDENKKLDTEEKIEFQRLKRAEETLTTEKGDLETRYGTLETKMTSGQIKAALAKAAKGIVSEGAIDDLVNVLSKDFVLSDGKVLTSTELGDKSGLEATAYLNDYVSGRDYLKASNSGGGAGGEKGSGEGTQANKRDDKEISVFQDLQ